jgi:hypothetical protein
MNCLESQEILQRRLDGEPIAANAGFERHLTECAVCRERHAAARALLEALKAAPEPIPSPLLAPRVLAVVQRDRVRRRDRLRRSLYMTAGLAAAILVMLIVAYFNNRFGWLDNKAGPGPIADHSVPKPEAPPAPPPPDPEKKSEPKPKESPTLAALTGRIADKTLDQAKLMLAAANPVEGMPMGDLPPVAGLEPLDPAAQPLRQAGQDATESLSAVGRSARRALDYFSRELPMIEPHP